MRNAQKVGIKTVKIKMRIYGNKKAVEHEGDGDTNCKW